MSIDERLLDRRKTVAEERAKRSVHRLLRLLAALAAVGAVLWAVLSPLLSVHEVRISGVEASSAHEILVTESVVAGTPMIMLRPGAIETALEADPWIGAARVRLLWPNDVMVEITERVPLAWVESGDGWSRWAVDGVALPSASSPDDSLARIHLPALSQEEASGSRLARGALEFVEGISPSRRPGVVIMLDDGELWVEVEGFRAQLGRPLDMREKALSLEALLEETLTEGSTLILVAPTNPAVRPPEQERASEDEETEGQDEEGNSNG